MYVIRASYRCHRCRRGRSLVRLLVTGAGSLDGFEVFVWSVQTGKILDVLRGHEGPISGLAFSSEKPIMASSSWDRAVRLWQLYATKDASEVLEHQTEVLAVAFRPDGL